MLCSHLRRVFVLISIYLVILTRSSEEAEWNEDELQTMALKYYSELGGLSKMIKQGSIHCSEKALAEGERIFNKAIETFPDEAMPHAHQLLAELHAKVGSHEEAVRLYDEAIRRAGLPVKHSADPNDLKESKSLVQELNADRQRSKFLVVQSEIDTWDANTGTISHELLSLVESQLNVFPKHPESLFQKAALSFLTLDAPATNGDDSTDKNELAWEAYETFERAQLAAHAAYTDGKLKGLAGGKQCASKMYRKDNGVLAGAKLWSQASSNVTAILPESQLENDDYYMAEITLEFVLISGKDAVISGYGARCQVFVPHIYVNLADNLPMVTSFESNEELSTVYLPSGNPHVYGGNVVKSLHLGTTYTKIPDVEDDHVFESIVLLTGYDADNYFHFVTEILPSIVSLRYTIDAVLGSEKEEDVMVIPNMEHTFVEGFIRLMVPNAFDEHNVVSSKVLQWGPGTGAGMDEGDDRFTNTHPIASARRVVVAAWDSSTTDPVSTVWPPPPHSMTPAPLLELSRSEVWNKTEVKEEDHGNLKVVYCSRSSSQTRHLADEDELLSRLEELASTIKAEIIVFEKKGDSSMTPQEFAKHSVLLFHSADVVIGVSGSSLANTAFSRPGTTVVELGFESLPQTSQYRHLSNSLGLNHVNVFLEKDSRRLRATEVKLRDGGFDAINAILQAAARDRLKGPPSDITASDVHSEL